MDQSGHGAPDASFANAIAEHFGHVSGQVGDEEDDGDHVGEGIQPDHQHHPISENGTGGIGDCVSNENYWPSEIKKKYFEYFEIYRFLAISLTNMAYDPDW